MTQKILIAIVGPTAIGKTKWAIAIAKYFNTEIISSDSRQFYKEMQIGTAVPTAEELTSVTHHFIQHRSIFENYTVGDFEKEALRKLDVLFKKKDVVVMVGGSGLYVDAITKGLDDFPEINPQIRTKLNETLKNEGIEPLQNRLKALDSEYYSKVDLKNPQRIIRALEVCIATGKPYSYFTKGTKKIRAFKTITIGIQADREVIYDRINRRVDLMINEGLIDEVKALEKYKELNALQTVGYKELFNHFEGKWSLEFAISEIKKNTRRFAKRQMTWFKKKQDILWIPYDATIDEVINLIKNKIANGK